MYKKALQYKLSRDQIREIAQFYERGFGNIEKCFEETLSWARSRETYTLFIGSLKSKELVDNLKSIKQLQKDLILDKCLSEFFETDKTPDSRLLDKKYTIIFKPEENELYKKIKNKNFDKIITESLLKRLVSFMAVPKSLVEEGKNSAIRLGKYVQADGLLEKRVLEIQSHTHVDHLSN